MEMLSLSLDQYSKSSVGFYSRGLRSSYICKQSRVSRVIQQYERRLCFKLNYILKQTCECCFS